MKRKLDEKERKLSEKSLKRLDKEVKELEQNYDYNKALVEKQRYLRDFDNKWRDYLRQRKDDEDEKVLKMIEDEKKRIDETIQITSEQLKNGVEIRKITGVD